MNGARISARGRAVLGALAIFLISASLPAGAIPAGDQLKPVNEVVNVYDEDHPMAANSGNGTALAYVNVAKVETDTPEGEVHGEAGHLMTRVDTEARIAELLAGANKDGGANGMPAWREASRGEHGGALGGDYRVVLGKAEPPPGAPVDGGAGGTVEGVLGLAGYYLRSHRQGSYAEMDAATGWMRAHRFGLVSDVGSRGLRSVVTGAGAGAKAALTVEGLQINLNDIFPNEHVNLPLGLTLDVAQQVTLPGGRTAELAFQRLLEAERRIDTMARVMREIDSVMVDVEPLVAMMPGYDTAKQTLEQAQDKLFNAKDLAEREAAKLVQKVAEHEQANAAVAQINAMYSAAMQDLKMVRDQVQAVEAEIAAVQAEIMRIEEEKQLLDVLPPVQTNPGGAGGLVGVLSVRRGARLRALATIADLNAQLSVLHNRLESLTEALADSHVAEQLMSAMAVELAEDKELADAALSTAEAERLVMEDAVATANALVDEAQAELTSANQTLDQLYQEAAKTDDKVNQRLDRLQELSTELDPIVEEARLAAVDLVKLLPIYQGLNEALRPWPVFKIDAITYELDTQVTDDKVVQKVRCGLEGVELLGVDLSIDTCEDLRDEREYIENELEKFLSQFSVTPPDVRLDLPTATTDQYPVVDGVKQALSTLTGLRLRIAPFEVKQLTTPVVDNINALLDEIQVSRAMDEVREIADLQGPVSPLTDWDMDWIQRPPTSDPWRASTGERMSVMASNMESEEDVDEEIDDFQEVLEETNGDETVGGQGTSGLDAQVGELGTNVTWAGCDDCGTCVVGSPGCGGDPCYVDPALCDDDDCDDNPDPCHGDPCEVVPELCEICDPADPDCDVEICDPADETCEQECLPGVPSKIGEPCMPKVPGCVDGRWQGPRTGNGVGEAGDASGVDDGTGSGSDGVPIGDVVSDPNLPHTGGRPAMLLLGLLLLMAAGLLRRSPATD